MSKVLRAVFLTLSFALVVFLKPIKAEGQTLFQNNNAICESELVICSSVTVGTCIADPAASISCKNAVESTDFNGDGFVDCAAASSNTNSPTGTPNFSNVNVLMNQAAGATDCSSGSGDQFSPAQNNILTFGSFAGLTSIVTGLLNGDTFSDLAVAGVDNNGQSINSDRVVSGFSPGGGGFLPDTNITSDSALWPTNVNQFGVTATNGQQSLALIQCNSSDALDAVMPVGDSSDNSMRVNVLRNNGTGLQDIVGAGDSFDTNVPPVFEPVASLAVGDFNNDDLPDVAVSIDDSGGATPGVQSIVICLNLGGCNLSCTEEVDLNAIHITPNESQPFSIAAGDFDGDTNLDVVITETGLPTGQRGVHYFFGNGDGTLDTPGVDVPFTGGAFDGTPLVVTTGCFNNDNVVDVAATFSNPAPTSGSSDVRVVTSDGSGGLSPVLTLTLNTIALDFVNQALGIDAADFDNQGGDDIIALATQFNGGSTLRRAYVFMNSIEALAADAGPDQSVLVNTPLTLSGANCSVNPEIPGDPASFDVQWDVAPTVGSILTGGTTLTPTFTGSVAGTFTLTLTCTTRCDETTTDTMTITVVGTPPPPPPVLFSTQGGCLSNSLVPDGMFSGKLLWAFFLSLPMTLGFLRLGRKKRLMVALLLGLSCYSASSQALTKSFSVNTFEPTVDDSEYFTVYSSPTMLQRNYHVGFFLDYARDVYEFSGANNNNRIGGIVDSLLTGNIVGSYAIKDWFSIGLLIPVYFWEGIRSTNPALLVNENNFDLGDVQLVLKFRLLDRERHHVGISIVPFLITPTSTGSSDFLGEGAVNGGAKLIIDGRIKDRVSLALNVGFTTRSNVFDIAGNELDDQFLGGLGISVDILKKKLKFIAEAQIATTTANFFSNRRTMPAEARGGFRYTFANNHDINAGAGFGLSNGIGSPAWRGFIGYTYTKRPIAEVTAPQPPISEVNVGDELTLQDKIYFEFDKAVIRDISKPTLDKIAGFLKAHPEITKIKIEGNTCDLGSNSYNLRLSQRRAQAVVKYLEDQGISADRMGTVVGYGETRPIVPNTDEQHREQNRRVQIFVEAVNK